MLDEGHQILAVLTIAFVALHLATLVLDPLIAFSVINLLLPIAEPYRPLATDLGVLALYALAIVALSSWLRGRLRYAHWRRLHYVSFVTFVLVTLHGLLVGTDTSTLWMRAAYLFGSGTVLLLVLAQLFRLRGSNVARGINNGERGVPGAAARVAR